MVIRINRKTDMIKLNKPVYILSSAAVGSAKEKEGPLGGYFDITDDDIKFGTKTFEAGESEMQRLALNTLSKKRKRTIKNWKPFSRGIC